MSHVSKYKMKVKQLDSLKNVLKTKGIPFRENVKTHLYGSNRVQAAIEFKLEGWRYACAVTADGEIKYDHFGSESSTFNQLGELVKDYNKEVIMSKVFGFATNWWEETTKDATILTIEC